MSQSQADALRKKIEIDPEALDREWIEQPAKHFDCAVQHAEYQWAAAKAKSGLEIIEATVAQRLRKDNAEAGAGKRLTEAAIEELITLDPDVQKARQAVNDAIFRSNAARALVDASEQRMWSLKALSSLPGLVERGGTETEEQRLMARLARNGALGG